VKAKGGCPAHENTPGIRIGELWEPNMNRRERRAATAKQRKCEVGMVVKAHTFMTSNGLLYWFEHPEGFTREDGVPSDVEIHGPFKTEAEVEANQELVLLGPQCEVIDGGMWDEAWDKPQ
jgi:hypothetical protein